MINKDVVLGTNPRDDGSNRNKEKGIKIEQWQKNEELISWGHQNKKRPRKFADLKFQKAANSILSEFFQNILSQTNFQFKYTLRMQKIVCLTFNLTL